MESTLARRLHEVVEPYHSFIYFAPEGATAYADAGLKGQWMGYFASRAAAMGAVEAAVVQATFYNFAPVLVNKAIPDAWNLSTPEQVIAARLKAADQALQRLLGELIDGPEVRDAAVLARQAVEGADCSGRPLGGAHQALPWPDAPHMVLWAACAALREHRGDGHIAALVSHELNGREALLSLAAIKPSYRDFVRNFRGWTTEELDETQANLRARGLIDADDNGTPACAALRESIENDTDRMALQPYRALGESGSEQLVQALTPLAAAIKAAR